MRMLLFLYALITLFTIAKSTPLDDLKGLRSSCTQAANVLDQSLNSTNGTNTSSLIQNLVWQIGASNANLNSSSSTPGANSTGSLDPPYFDYVDGIRTLSEAVIRRGKIFHPEMNFPVYDALRSLARVVYAYGMQLADAGMISRNATIRTFTAGSAVVDAESVWANNANYPGKRRSKRSTYSWRAGNWA